MADVATVSFYTDQLAPLASQHHTSEYNRLKFGPKGCPTKYSPLSVHLPEIFQELRLRQEQSSLAKSWWPSYKPPSHPPVVLQSRDTVPDSVVSQLEKDIHAALNSSLDIILPPPVRIDPTIKTSSSHPINVSPIIPPELLHFVCSHIVPAQSSYPTIFAISPLFTLDRLAPPSPAIPQTVPTILSANPKPPPSVTDALRAAITDSFSFAAWSSRASFSSTAPVRSISLQPSPVIHNMEPGFPPSLSLSLSLPILHTTSDMPVVAEHSIPYSPVGSNTGLQDSHRVSPEGSPIESSLLLPPPSPGVKLGNLFLSSCPGKKVRLNGPVKGRGGVYRDLETDLRRIKQLGVGCLICCLDDLELDFLGAPWPQYEALARRTGLDVLRIPTPEGLAPLAPASLNAHLTQVIENYTLSGTHVLVHCRGGVGRAGVIACCWLIRLGLCGWVQHMEGEALVTAGAPSLMSSFQPDASPPSFSGPFSILQHGPRGVPVETIQFVERVISVIRRRRSMKAIETYEQVRFLVEFVEHLRSEAQANT